MATALTPRFGKPIGPWRPWFAWYPVLTCDRRVLFLRLALRRRVQLDEHLSGGPESWWQYTTEVD